MAAVLGRGIKNGLHSIGGGGGNTTGIGEVYTEDPPGNKSCLKSTFAPYYTVVFALNTVAIMAGIFSQFDFHRHQRYNHLDRVDAWYSFNAIFGALHILAAVYIVYKIEKPSSPRMKDVEAFGYSNMQQQKAVYDNTMPPPPQNPNYIQAHEVVVVPMDRSAATNHPRAKASRTSQIDVTEPLTWPRIKYVLFEDVMMALYIVVFILYLLWHYFMDFGHMNYRYNHSMNFVMRCADIFIIAGPASLLFSIGFTLATHRDH